jgi:hypothetical protein
MTVERVVQKFSSHSAAEDASRDYYRQLTPDERLGILLELVARSRDQTDASSQRLERVIESLNSNHVEYLIVGGYALAFHGCPRYTGDIDVLVRPSPMNAARLERTIIEFGFASLSLSAKDFLKTGRVVQLGRTPNRIDLLTSISGVGFDEAWDNRVAAKLDGLPVFFIDRASFIKNKKATGRTQDKADIEALGGE